MKYIVFTVLLVIMPQMLWAACVDDGDGTWSSTADYTSVNSCLSQASSGDTINVAAGTQTWNTTLTVTKNVQIIGAGKTQTIITAGADPLILYNPTTAQQASSNLFRISGFKITAGSGYDAIHLGGGDAWDPTTVPENLRIDNNHLISTDTDSNCTTNFLIFNFGVYGVIDNNTFDCDCYPFKHQPGNVDEYYYANFGSDQTDWSKCLYFEDNTITIEGAVAVGGIAIDDAQYAPIRHSYRYNDIISERQGGWTLIEIHGAQSDGMDAGFGKDVYANHMSFPLSESGNIFQARSGVNFIAFNKVDTSNGSGQVSMAASANVCPGSYTAEQLIHDNYVFRNLNNGTNMSTNIDETFGPCNGLSNIPTSGRDFFDEDSSPAVTLGTLGNLPETCSTGQGYWASSQTYTDLTDYTGVNPTTPLSGSLYKCVSTNNWSEYYVPHTYPHPLRDDASCEGTGCGVTLQGIKIE